MIIDVKKERESRGLTQQQLANLVEVHLRTVQKWEDKKIRDMKLSTYTRLKATFLTLELCEVPSEQA